MSRSRVNHWVTIGKLQGWGRGMKDTREGLVHVLELLKRGDRAEAVYSVVLAEGSPKPLKDKSHRSQNLQKAKSIK